MGRRKYALAPPFRALDPGLAAADRLLASGALRQVTAALPDEKAAAAALNEQLAATGAAPRLLRAGGGWRLGYLADRPEDQPVAAALTALAELVAVAGWERIKRCAVCGAEFCDRTAGRTRKWCAAHRPHPVS